MNGPTDQQLLRDYSERRSESAFAELVRRHVDFVYSAALRIVCDAHLAEDVTQAVFIALAQSAGQLADRSVLSGWLHLTTRNLAANAVRSDVHRRVREQEAAAMNELLSAESETNWQAIAPYLDAALGELDETDRDAVLLRYFEKKSAQEMAGVLGISAEAAQKRVSRAVERLREFFSKRNVTIGASGLVVLISTNAVQAAPVGLAVAVSTAAVLAGTAIHTSTVIATTKAIAMTTLQKAIVAATLTAAVGTGIYVAHQISQLRDRVQTLQRQQAPLAEQNQQLQSELNEATNRLAGLLAENGQLKSNSNENELLKLRAEVTRLRTGAQELTQSQTDNSNDPVDVAAKAWLTKVNLLKQRLDQMPNAKIPELQFATEIDWLNAALGTSQLNTDEDYLWDLHNLFEAVEDRFGKMGNKALQKYIQANNGQFPTNLSQLQPYFDSPVDNAILQRYEIVPASSIPKAKETGDDWLVAQKVKALENYKNEGREVFGANGYGNSWTFW